MSLHKQIFIFLVNLTIIFPGHSTIPKIEIEKIGLREVREPESNNKLSGENWIWTT